MCRHFLGDDIYELSAVFIQITSISRIKNNYVLGKAVNVSHFIVLFVNHNAYLFFVLLVYLPT